VPIAFWNIIGDIGIKYMMESLIIFIFRLCVLILNCLADVFHTDYYTINVVLFCVLMPVIFLLMFLYIIKLKSIIKSLRK